MSVAFHGKFDLYTPPKDPEQPFTMIPGAVFSRNQDGADFYSIRTGISKEALVVLVTADNVVRGASKGDLMAMPQNGQRMYSLDPAPEGLTPEQANGMILNVETGTLT